MFNQTCEVPEGSGLLGNRQLCDIQEVAETQEKAGLKEECIEFYDKARSPTHQSHTWCLQSSQRFP